MALCVNGSIKNCINNGDVRGNGERIGGIVGEGASESDISECINNGIIIGDGNCVGGISGIEFGSIEKCMNSGKISGKKSNIGGIAGETGESTKISIKNNYNIGNIFIDLDNVTEIGGIIGFAYRGIINHNYSLGEIKIEGKNVKNIGGVLGYTNSTVERSNNYYLEKKSNVTLNTEGEEKDSEYMKSTEFLSKLNESQTPAVWEFRTGENNRYPVFIKTDE